MGIGWRPVVLNGTVLVQGDITGSQRVHNICDLPLMKYLGCFHYSSPETREYESFSEKKKK